MGVTGLWTVVQPCARPIKIETLNKKRLAVDASIWIYQFLKAVRDKEGNALRNSHVVGFFRRICKLLFFGIKPVFVFDGGAPTLKRQTISGRKQRREGRREDAVRTAGKLLAVQMQRRAEEEEQKRKEAAQRPTQQEEEPLPDNLVYVDELQMTQQERQQNRKFKRTDQYHLPQLDVALSEMVGGNDPRVMSMEELEQYARQFDTGEDINVYDFSKIDYDSPFFLSLPPSDRYNILNAARLRSRLRMGHSKDQLDTLFPDRMAFSRFQIDRVKERNELTQRVMHVNGMGDDAAFGINGTSRVSGEKGREYVLVKNSGAEGGWALGVIGDRDEGRKDKPIDVDQPDRDHEDSAEDEWEDENEDFEDVPIEGLNRLPKSMKKKQKQANGALQDLTSKDVLDRRRALYEFRLKSEAVGTEPRHDEPDALFLAEDPGEEAVSNEEHLEDGDMQKAIEMSLQYGTQGTISDDEQDDDYAEVFGVGQNARSEQDRREVGVLASSKGLSSSNNAIRDASLDIEEALRESRQSTYHPPLGENPTTKPVGNNESSKSNIEKKTSRSDGPLPFESMDLGSSLLGKKKIKKIQEESAGGFISENEKQEKKSAPIPPWFTGDLEANIQAQNDIEFEDRAKDKKADEEEMFEFQTAPKLRQQDTQEVIDVDAPGTELRDTIHLDSDEEQSETMPARESETFVEDQEIRMGDIADLVRVEPPSRPSSNPDSEEPNGGQVPKAESQRATKLPSKEPTDTQHPTLESQEVAESPSEEPLEWEESDHEQKQGSIPLATRSKSSSPEFEDVDLLAPQPNDTLPIGVDVQEQAEEDGPPPMSGTANQYMALEDEFGPQDIYSDAEEDELMRHLAAEAEEHARFASTLNNKTQRQNAEDYEQELKALRSQQKKDRRDADEVTQIMITECQQLLKLFGLPYITAPMEAEAQCAELVALGLVDGIVTDDSDIFLFGGTRVYKNMFNQAKFVECYLSSDLERDFDLTREKLIRAAHLLGSDYTEGLPGVGPVTALEIVSEFPEGLDMFKEWWIHVQTGAPPSEEDKQSPFRQKFRKNSTKLFLPAGFPDQRVDLAYLQPEVDSDPSAFQWGIPDLDALRAFLMATIGWSQERTDEVLVPVIKDMNRRENEGTQANITSFLESGSVGAGAFAPRVRSDGKSKRMEKALGNMAERARNKRKAELRTAAEDDDDHDNDTDEIAAQDAVIAVPGSIAAATETRSPAATRKTKTRSKKKQLADTNTSANEHDDDDSDEFRPKKRSKTRSNRA